MLLIAIDVCVVFLIVCFSKTTSEFYLNFDNFIKCITCHIFLTVINKGNNFLVETDMSSILNLNSFELRVCQDQ